MFRLLYSVSTDSVIVTTELHCPNDIKQNWVSSVDRFLLAASTLKQVKWSRNFPSDPDPVYLLLAVGEGALWLTNRTDVIQISPQSNQLQEWISSEGSLWTLGTHHSQRSSRSAHKDDHGTSMDRKEMLENAYRTATLRKSCLM